MTEITTYKSYDGKEFETKEMCENYESKRLELFLKNKIVINNCDFYHINSLQKLRDFNFYLECYEYDGKYDDFYENCWVTFSSYSTSPTSFLKILRIITLEDYLQNLEIDNVKYGNVIENMTYKIQSNCKVIEHCKRILNVKD